MNVLGDSYIADKHKSYRVKVAAGWVFQAIDRAVQDADDLEASK